MEKDGRGGRAAMKVIRMGDKLLVVINEMYKGENILFVIVRVNI